MALRGTGSGLYHWVTSDNHSLKSRVVTKLSVQNNFMTFLIVQEKLNYVFSLFFANASIKFRENTRTNIVATALVSIEYGGCRTVG